MVFCTYCGQSFTRDEHLERHILTHTNVKPFKCFTCHMSFARRDLLQRHYTVHGRDQNNQEGLPPNNGMIPKSAGRTPIACNNCAKTKTKCDKKFPCSRCASRNLRCTLRPTRRQSKNAACASVEGQANANGVTTSAEQTANPTPSTSSRNSPQQQPLAAPSVGPELPVSNRVSPEDKAASDGPFFDQSPPLPTAPMVPNTLSPLPTPGGGFATQTPMWGQDDLIRAGRDGLEQDSSPRFLMEWGPVQMGPPFDPMNGRPDLMMAPPIDMSMGGMHELPMIPEMSQSMSMPHVQTPIATPRLEGSLSDLEIGSSAAMFYPPTRQTSVSEASANADLAAVVAAQDSWNCFRCTPLVPSTSCPKTAKLNLEKLEQTLRNHETWSKWRPSWDEGDLTGGEHLSVMPLHESTRDKLLAITQSFLHKALDIHKEGASYSPSRGESPCSTTSNFVLLPPARVLEAFLKSYANSFERYFPMTAKGLLDPNELMMQCYNDKAASLLVLMMIAQGAMVMPSSEARGLTGGLTEACRISLFDLIEKNIIMAGDLMVLHSALLFTVQATWSGDKWHMDIAMGQRGMYISMLRHHGMLEPRHAMTPPIHQHNTQDGLWSDWIQQEAKSRLIYSWAMVDQDVSLFHDTAPLFAVTEFGAPMPDADRLWNASSAAEWSTVFNEVHQFSGGYNSVGSGARPLCLRDLFRHFLADEVLTQGIELTPLHLRLLLHPLQSMVHQYCQLLSCFSESGANQQRTKTVTAASTRSRLEEVQSLLQRWYDLADRYMKIQPVCAMMQANMVMFHLISLNAVTNFPEIERLARRENFDGTYQQLVWVHKRCISDVEEAVFHCGQVLRLVRSMSRGVRPPWWAGAIYRASLILWTDSLTHNESLTPSSGLFPVPGPSFAIDSLPAEHPLVVRYLTKREGVPTLSKRDGSQIPLDQAFAVLSHCVEVIEEGVSTRFSDGIKSKLQRLARG